MKVIQRHDLQDTAWYQDTPVHVSPGAFDALSHILGQKIAQGVHLSKPVLSTEPSDAPGGQPGQSDNAQEAARYEWSARYLLNKMRIETS